MSARSRVRHRLPRKKAADVAAPGLATDFDDIVRRCAFTPEEHTVANINGEPEGVMTIGGMLKFFYHADPERPRKASMREFLRRFQRISAAAVARETVRAEPRDLGAVLAETFNLPALLAAIDDEMKNGNRGAFQRALDEAVVQDVPEA